MQKTAPSLLNYALVISLMAHLILLVMNFGLPNLFQIKASEPTLEVILVNARSATKPLQAEALAQVNLDGGGDKNTGRAQSPLPDMRQILDGDELQQVESRVVELESSQKKLVAQVRLNSPVQAMPQFDKKVDVPNAKPKAADAQESSQALVRMEAEIAKQIEDYNKRPKKHFYSPSTSQYVATLYVDNWRTKVERWGNSFYPESAKGKVYGTLILTVEIDKDGQVIKIDLDKSSGHPVLDKAAMETVRRAAPYGKFTPEMIKDVGNVLVVSRTWVYTNDALATQAR